MKILIFLCLSYFVTVTHSHLEDCYWGATSLCGGSLVACTSPHIASGRNAHNEAASQVVIQEVKHDVNRLLFGAQVIGPVAPFGDDCEVHEHRSLLEQGKTFCCRVTA